MFKETRIKNKLTQEEMAKILNVTQQMITMIEKRKRYPGFDTILNFIEHFGLEELNREIEKEIEIRNNNRNNIK